MDKQKIERLKRLLLFLGSKEFEWTLPLLVEQHEALYKRMKEPARLRECDSFYFRIDLSQEPPLVHVYTAHEHPRGDYGGHREEVPLFDEFLDFACNVLANRAHSKVSVQIRQQERERHEKAVAAVLSALGLVS